MSTLSSAKTRTKGNYVEFPKNGINYKCKRVKFNKSYFPHYTILWNKMSSKLKNCQLMEDFKSIYLTEIKSIKYKHFNVGQKVPNALLCRVRLSRSYLNSDSYSIGHSDSPMCWCHAPFETSMHYVLICWLFEHERVILLQKVKHLVPKFMLLPKENQLKILLYGYQPENRDFYRTNIKLQLAMQQYITDTKRFALTPTPFS